MTHEEMGGTFATGELFVYTNGDRWELGMVKSPNNTGDGYFCWYSRGDTAANTPTRCMHKLANAGYTQIEESRDELGEMAARLQGSLNALRQIVKDMAETLADDELCDGHCTFAELCEYRTGGCWLTARARELGCEV